jgi:phage-related baseplate assembly protein
MPLSIDELTTPLSADEAKESIYNVLAALGTNTTSWKPGAVARTIIAAVSIVIAAFSELTALIAKSGFLELAEGPWLTLVARYVFGVERTLATFAAGQVTLTNGAGGVFDMGIGDVIVKNTTSGKTYRTTEAFHLGVTPAAVTVGIEAVEAGSPSSSGAGEIDGLETSMIGVLVTNAAAVTGLDDESDTSLRARALEARSPLSPNGPRDSYAYFARGARRASDGSLIGVTRVRVSRSSPIGVVTVTVAGPSGAISGVANDPATDLGAIDLAIKTNVVPDGVIEITQSATSTIIPITFELWIYSSANISNGEILALVQSRLADFMTTQPIGGNVIGAAAGKVFVDAIRTVIGAARPEIFHVLVSAPAGDVVLAESAVPMLGVVTATIHREVA